MLRKDGRKIKMVRILIGIVTGIALVCGGFVGLAYLIAKSQEHEEKVRKSGCAGNCKCKSSSPASTTPVDRETFYIPWDVYPPKTNDPPLYTQPSTSTYQEPNTTYKRGNSCRD